MKEYKRKKKMFVPFSSLRALVSLSTYLRISSLSVPNNNNLRHSDSRAANPDGLPCLAA